ncbi:MAG TPA: FG-GAP-like repeat-containing protein [Smithella sp.]|nr:FG-GAP-like repeat-containing protein [Smithella sp.]
MKRIWICILPFVLIFLAAGASLAKDKYTVTILPFSLHSAENIDYIKEGIETMLSSRIASSDKITVISRDVVAEELKKSKIKEISVSDIHNLGSKLKSDFVVWGSITKIGNAISIDAKLTDIAKEKPEIQLSSQSQTLDDVIPKINDFSERIVHHILGTTPQPTPPAVSAAPSGPASPQVPASMSRESQIIAGMKSGGKRGGTLTSVINSEYINAAEPFNRKGFWMSQKIPTEFKGMAIGDVNGDGLNEVVLIDKNTVHIYQKTDKELKLIDKIKGKSYLNYLAVDVADINKNGIPEIFITSLNNQLVNSFVLEFKNGKFETIASDIRYFLRVIDTTPEMPLLLAQGYGINKPFDSEIFEMIWKNGKYVTDQKMKIPYGLSIYGLTIDDLGVGGKEKIFALDEYDYLYIIEKTTIPLSRLTSIGFTRDELIWRSDDVYGGSNNYFENLNNQNPDNTDSDKNAFVNLRILTFDTNQDGKKEIIIVKNLSTVGRIFKKLKLFTSSEIYDLEWDGMGMAENWRTKKINGYVADYAIKDIDNDGKPEICLALVLSVGASLKDKSVVAVYELEPAQ